MPHRLLPFLLTAISCFAAPVDIFVSGAGGYHTYRIPSLLVSSKGTLLAFCEGRKDSARDNGNIDVLLRRSSDRGRTWQSVQLLADFGDDTVGNPAAVLDRSTGTIFLLLNSAAGRTTEDQVIGGVAPSARRVWVMSSRDDGASWSKPVEITGSVKPEGWTWYATGPGNGIQLESGRLVIACDHNTSREGRYSHIIYSDDHGATWKVGGTADVKTNESTVAELRDGSLLLNMRSYHGRNRRAVQRSRDGGLTWEPLALDEALVEPVCEGSLITTVPLNRRSNGRLLFSNPADTKRQRLTVRLSDDDGATWKHARVIHEGPSAYSSLAMLNDKTAGLLYERGSDSPYERITFARFPLKWVASAK